MRWLAMAHPGQIIISGLVVVGFFSVVTILLLFHPQLDSAGSTILNVLTGTLGAEFSAVVRYHFGSSLGSKAKDEILQQLAAGGTDTKGAAS